MTIQQILLKYWGFSNFRPLQEEIINSVLEGKDTLALMPTGGGKSVCFQIPALAREGICIVVSPLIALMKDQVENLKGKNIKAVSITSGMSKGEIDVAFDNCIHGDIKFLYLSPERLESELAQVRIKKMKVNLIVVDEAHCISQWGYDFRPSYMKIALLRELHPNIPVLALTATATADVVEDIQKSLVFKKPNVLRKSFERKNLAYMVRFEEDKMGRLLKILNKVKGTGIIYVRNRKRTQEISEFLKHNNISADFYHAGLEHTSRNEKQEAWISAKTHIMVCTNAFGMGIDKPNVRIVVHLDIPSDPESYFQEAGRAGRDELKSFAVLLYNASDIADMNHNLEISFPPVEEIKMIYQALANYYQIPIGLGLHSTYNFDGGDFYARYNINPVIAFNSLKLLEKEGYLSLTDGFYQPSKIHFTINKENLYKFQVENKAYDGFIKLLLRSYTGLFDNYVKISEQDLARRAEKKIEEIKNLLHQLHKHEIIFYTPYSESPQLTFLIERDDAKHIHISPENLQKRRSRMAARIRWMQQYVKNKTKCRSRILLSYFDETDTYRCGICDICLERNKLELSNLEFENIKNQIKKLLIAKPMDLKELLHTIKDSTEEKSLKVIRWLLDSEKISYSPENTLKWHP